jgi:ABC-type glycerol-3-phosphate transport system substrate-binding protein
MKLRPFELALILIFGGLALAALFILKFYQPEPEPEEELISQIGAVDIWGTLPAAGMNSLLDSLREQSDSYSQINYRYILPEGFDDTLVTALADGEGPDLVLISHEELVPTRPRIQPVSYESFPLRDYKNSYLDGAEIFALADGLYGYPVAVDPLMMYWNRDLLATAGYLTAPKTWEGLINDMFPNLIQRDFDRTINRSVVAMGEYGNVRNAFGLISALLIQQGSRRVVEESEGHYLVLLDQSLDDRDPLMSTADFYTRFSKPSNTLYSWNRAFENDRLQFIGEDLTFYFGFGSEASEIERLNPNLNFDIAEVPQGEGSTLRRTYGRFYGLSMLKSSDNLQGASIVMLTLGSAENTTKIAQASGMVPPYRTLVQQGSNDTIGRVTYQSAGIALGWLNPGLEASNAHFDTMVRDINENRREISGATADLLSRLRNEY